MTPDGSSNEKITPEGFSNNETPLTTMYLPPRKAEPSCNMADGQRENKAEEEEMLNYDREIPEEQG